MEKKLVIKNDITEISKLAIFIEELSEELALAPELTFNLNLVLEYYKSIKKHRNKNNNIYEKCRKKRKKYAKKTRSKFKMVKNGNSQANFLKKISKNNAKNHIF